jgi:hypothetical protein
MQENGRDKYFLTSAHLIILATKLLISGSKYTSLTSLSVKSFANAPSRKA